MTQLVRRAILAAVLLLPGAVKAPAAAAPVAALTLDGLRDPAYLLLAQDAAGDLATPFSVDPATDWADLTNLYVTTDTTHLWVYVDLPSYSNQSTGQFGLALDTDGLAASGGTFDPWGNAITYAYTSTYNNVQTSPVLTNNVLLPDVVIHGQLYSNNLFDAVPVGWTELDSWNGLTWSGSGVNWGGVTTSTVGTHVAFAYGKGIELSIPFSDIDIAPTQTVNLEFYATRQVVVGHHQGAWDTIPSDTQALTDTVSTTERRLATLGLSQPITLPLVSFSSSSYFANEAGGSAPITLTVTPTSTRAISVTFRTSDGTAGPKDYSPISQTLLIGGGQAADMIAVPILTDTLTEGDETVHLILSQPLNAVLGQPFTATLTIHDTPPLAGPPKLFLPFAWR